MKIRTMVLGVTVLGGTVLAGSAAPTASAQYVCHWAYLPDAYGNCIPDMGYDLDCAEIGYGIYQLADPYTDPYGLDVYNGVGNGWTCDGIG